MKRRAAFRIGLLLFALTMATACSSAGRGIIVSNAWVRTSPAIDSAAYMMIENAGDREDRLLAVTSDAAASVELHETQEMDGMMQMTPAQAITVPAHGQVQLKPGAMHVMLMGLRRELKAGDQVTLTLNFEKAGSVRVETVVREQ
jgi:copper(I)-binding protein